MSDLSLFHGPNAGYVLELYELYQRDPQAVEPELRALFAQWEAQNRPATAGAAPPEPGVPAQPVTSRAPATPAPAMPAVMPAVTPSVPVPAAPPADLAERSPLDVTRTVAAARLIRYIRELGHLDARIDPLDSEPPGDPGLREHIHGISEADLAVLPAHIVRGPLVGQARNALDGVRLLRAVYSASVGYETDHIQNYEERTWLREAIEDRRFYAGIDDTRKRELLERLTEVEAFERFLHTTFVGQKRFSIEGCDMVVPMLDTIIRNAATVGTHEVVIGMAHRGRLNVLAHVLGKPYTRILAEFIKANRDAGTSPSSAGSVGWSGDVKYHLGARRAYRESGVSEMPITLAPNPSHLEFVNPVIEGRARAAQERRDQSGPPEHDPKASLAILLHGDAAFPGQGIVAETLNLSRLAGYNTGGTIHIILNNQIGFTTEPRDTRSTLYAADLAKGFEIPIVHVNADDPIACVAVSRLAHEYRLRFGKDFLIDLVGYRRWGHNEGDEPAFTQPQLYARISRHPTVRALWATQLERDGVISSGEADALNMRVLDRLQQARKEATEANLQPLTEGSGRGEEATTDEAHSEVPAERLRALNKALLTLPEGFSPHPRLERFLQRRVVGIDEPEGIDWAHAEALAFAAILEDGIPIRLTGQDAERGTFSHRHLVLHDPRSGMRYNALQHLPQAQASFAVHNSPLSENAALGFEYGYSMHAPHTLVLWEAQFGDFINGAQVIVDQFLVSGRAKWNQTPSLVLLLPHGYEGQGPEHSSARIERFLQLAASDNIRVANPTTAGQYFHLLRRQVQLLEREPRPLIVFTPKSLLRHPRSASSLAALSSGAFQPVMSDGPAGAAPASEVNRLILCSGKVAVDLISNQAWSNARGVALARVEELYPFPSEALQALLQSYPELHEVVWLQEEPQNMGAWSFLAPRLRALLGPDLPLRYIGRDEAASTAEGSLAEHVVVQARIVAAALEGQHEPVER